MTASVAGLRLAYSLLCALRAQEVAYEVISSFFATVVADSLVIEGNVSTH